jgi:hypothetical protein
MRQVGSHIGTFEASSVFTTRYGAYDLLSFLEEAVSGSASVYIVASWTAPATSSWDEYRRSGLPPEDS